jgi:hypothetical protein
MDMLDNKDSVRNEQFNSEPASAQATVENMDEHSPEIEKVETAAQTVEVNTPSAHVHEDLPELLIPVEIDEDEEFNDDPTNILDEEEHKEIVEDYSILTKEEIIKTLDFLIRNKPVESIRQNVEGLKINFYKKVRAELDARRKAAEERGEDPETILPEPDEAEERLKELLRQYRDLKTSYNERVESEKQHNLKEKYKIIDEIKELVNRKESINETFHVFRELQNRWRSIGVVPQSNLKDLWETYHHYVEIFYDFIKINKELRDLDLKRNLEAKIALCEKSEELLLEPSIVKSFKTLQKYHEQWREIGPVPQEMKSEIWERFKAITSKINKKHQEYFENLKDNQKKNLDQKNLLCERAEEINNTELKSPKDWEKYYQEMVELQKVWRTIGFAPKKDNNRVYNRFRAACDSFFSRKRDFFS